MSEDFYKAYACAVANNLKPIIGLGFSLMPGEYRNPFDFLTEFDQWFEFVSRKRFGKESTYDIIRQMLRNDLSRASRAMDVNYSSARMQATMQFGATVIFPKSILITTTA